MSYVLENIRQTYGERTVLDVPSLTINAGEILALVGPSGAGKSTLLRLLALLENPAEGRLRLELDGQTTNPEVAPLAARRKVTMAFQRPLLLQRTVAANVAYGLRLRGDTPGDAARVDEALARVGLSALAKAQPDTLSGGEMQRVALARALVLEPRVLLLDEPTANLDPYNVRLIEELVVEQNEKHATTVVIATHNIFQAKRLAQRVALLWEGHLVEVAETAAFFDAPQDPRTAAFVRGDLVW